MKSTVNTLKAILLIALFTACSDQSQATNDNLEPGTATEVTYQSEGVTISADLWLPEGSGPHPAIVIGHGSGRARKEFLSSIGRHFSSIGFAVLTYDKRGVGGSGGEYVERNNASEENLKLLAKDISAGIDFLKKRPDIDRHQIGLWGVSQAGWILPIVTELRSDIKFTILISGPTVTVGEENTYSRLTGDRTTDTGLTQAEMSAKLKERGPYGFDPRPYLEKMDMPGLWLLGEKDESIPIPETVNILDELIDGGRNFRYRVYPGANHGLRANGARVADYWKDQDDFLLKTVGIRFH